MIKEFKFGYYIEPNNPIDFADALEKAAENRNALKKMGKKARFLAKNKFDRNIIGEEFVRWLEESVC